MRRRRRAPAGRRSIRRPVRARRVTRRRRVTRAAQRSNQNGYRRTFYRTFNFIPQAASTTTIRFNVNASDFNSGGVNELLSTFQKYRIVSYLVQVKPDNYLDSAQFANTSQSNVAFYAYDPFDSLGTTPSNNAIGNFAYARRASIRGSRRRGRPVLIRDDATPSGGYQVTKSPWINCDDNAIEHYASTFIYPAVQTASAAQGAVNQRVEQWVTIEFSGKRFSTV